MFMVIFYSSTYFQISIYSALKVYETVVTSFFFFFITCQCEKETTLLVYKLRENLYIGKRRNLIKRGTFCD